MGSLASASSGARGPSTAARGTATVVDELLVPIASDVDVVIARDQGPGIPDVGRALQDGYSTSGGLGLGLPGARRLMDEFDVSSVVGKGTTVTMKKWRQLAS